MVEVCNLAFWDQLHTKLEKKSHCLNKTNAQDVAESIDNKKQVLADWVTTSYMTTLDIHHT